MPRLSFEVVDEATGTPIAGATILLFPDAGAGLTAQTDAAGDGAFDLAPGFYGFYVTAPDYWDGNGRVQLVVDVAPSPVEHPLEPREPRDRRV